MKLEGVEVPIRVSLVSLSALGFWSRDRAVGLEAMKVPTEVCLVPLLTSDFRSRGEVV